MSYGGLVAKSCPTLAIPWTVACQAPLSMEFFRQEYWYGSPFPSPGDLPNPEIEPGSSTLFTVLSHQGSPCLLKATSLFEKPAYMQITAVQSRLYSVCDRKAN